MKQFPPCPFCGEDELLKPALLGNQWKTIKCLACGAQGPISKDGLEAKLWSQRIKKDANETTR